MKSLLAAACTLSLLLTAAEQAQAGPRDGFTGMMMATAKDKPPPSPTETVRDHRATPGVRDHRWPQGGVRVTSKRRPPQPGPICAGWAC